ncbi:Gldg family protein [Pseudobacter ginsenosidimutans]|uniref:ABC-2 type transport system permease protein n=1 Tax=Pseudobacter ginsenosidimutans TaxID=661488 RepID=A0A4Q7N4J5_9BACT|nr:Gldg family protein [Pseudobacter ginsenosidimutans]QEC44453.1 ABC transporter permease subunit [Pseudobacter ginsenosidimutans]RZS75925.1 ABC-2 type transport system permease protein [Pseudobacter ginsenosidimutans]
MKVIFSIAKNEFRYLFYSPIAWFFLLVFLVQCAVFFTGPVYDWANTQEILLKNMPSYTGAAESLTKDIFYTKSFLHIITRNLYLFIPILTMGLISREVNSGTTALLFSSPVNLRRVVLGKYIGIMLYNLLLLLIITLFLVAGIVEIKHADHGMLLSAALGFYLLICTYSAIGMFMSCLSSYQIVSALATFVVLFILTHIGSLWQRYDFVRDLTYLLSLQNRTNKMLYGLIVTKDVIYFVVITFMFMAFTFIRLQNNRQSKSSFIKVGRYLAVFVVVVCIGYVSSRPALTGYWDTSAGNQNTIHAKTQATLREFSKDSALEVTLYTNLLGRGLGRGMPEARNSNYLDGLWEPYLRFKPDIRFKYEYYYDNDPAHDDSALYRGFPGKPLTEIATETAELIDASLDMFKAPDEMRKVIDLNPEGYHLVMQLKYKGRTTFLRTYADTRCWPDESNMIAALKRVLGTDMPQVGFVTGELERSIIKTGEREYALHSAHKGMRVSLLNTGFDVDTINLSSQDIPNDLNALILADPKMDLGPVVMDKLKNYIDKGGNLMVSSEPGKQYVVNPLLSHLGVQLMHGQILQPTPDETPDKVFPLLTKACGGLSEDLAASKKLKRGDTIRLLMPGVTGITVTGEKGFRSDSLAVTLADKTWLKAGPVVIDSILPPFNPMEGDIGGHSFKPLQKMTRTVNGKEQRVVIAGDADFAGNLRVGDLPVNFTILMSSYSWLTNNQFPVFMPRPDPRDLFMTIGERTAYYQKIAFVWVLPAIILIGGTVLLIRRKRK